MEHATPTSERWLPVVGYEDLYEVSDHGRVYSLGRLVVQKNGVTRPKAPRFMKQQLAKRGGYPVVGLNRDGHSRLFKVATLVLTAFCGPRPPGMYGCHEDGDPTNSRLDNLAWGTPQSNALDRRRHGTHYQVDKETCPYGHLLAPPNLVACVWRRGYRSCLACSRARVRYRVNDQAFQAYADSRYHRIMTVAA